MRRSVVSPSRPSRPSRPAIRPKPAKRAPASVIPLLADLDRMRRQIEETFPGFQEFKRPGLDPE